LLLRYFDFVMLVVPPYHYQVSLKHQYKCHDTDGHHSKHRVDRNASRTEGESFGDELFVVALLIRALTGVRCCVSPSFLVLGCASGTDIAADAGAAFEVSRNPKGTVPVNLFRKVIMAKGTLRIQSRLWSQVVLTIPVIYAGIFGIRPFGTGIVARWRIVSRSQRLLTISPRGSLCACLQRAVLLACSSFWCGVWRGIVTVCKFCRVADLPCVLAYRPWAISDGTGFSTARGSDTATLDAGTLAAKIGARRAGNIRTTLILSVNITISVRLIGSASVGWRVYGAGLVFFCRIRYALSTATIGPNFATSSASRTISTTSPQLVWPA